MTTNEQLAIIRNWTDDFRVSYPSNNWDEDKCQGKIWLNGKSNLWFRFTKLHDDISGVAYESYGVVNDHVWSVVNDL